MKSTTRRFDVSVSVVRPNYNSASFSSRKIIEFVSREPSGNNGESIDMVGYSFEEATTNESSFSLTLVPSIDNDGKSWVDKIAPMDLVFFNEFGKTRFCGVVHECRYVTQMGDNGSTRTVTVKGSSFGDLISNYKLVLDKHLWINSPVADIVSRTLSVEIAEKAERSLKRVLQIIWNSFKKLAVMPSGEAGQTCGVFTVIEHYCDFDTGISSSLKSLYELAIGLYHVGENNLWEIWRSIIPPPLYELFGVWESSSEMYKIIARQTPYDAEDWKNLKTTKVNPICLTDYSVGRDDSEVRTFFYCTLPGSDLDQNEILAIDNYKAVRKINTEKWGRYGLRPMETSFRYYNRDPNTKKGGEQQVLSDTSERLLHWYGKCDEFLNGQIDLIGVDNPKIMEYPRIGEKLSFLGGEWYIERTLRSWVYGKSPRVTMDITRGYVYQNGAMQSPIPNVGKRLLELEDRTV